MDGLHIRQATVGDKQAVIDINDNVYKGIDYVQALYEDELINSPNTKSYVAVFDNNIVGFAAATVVDDGQTVISRAARINKQYANKGFYKRLKNHASSNSGASIDAFTTADTNPAINSTSFQQQNRLVFKLVFLAFNLIPQDDRLKTTAIASSIKTKILTLSLLEKYFKTDENRKYLFPKERLLINWVPFRPVQSNISLLWDRSEHCNRVTDVRHEDKGVKGLMSILTTFIGGSGVLVSVLDVFGTDVDSLKYHLASHFDFLSKRNDTEIMLSIVSEMEYEAIEHIFGEFGMKKEQWNPFSTPSYQKSICLYERSLKAND